MYEAARPTALRYPQLLGYDVLARYPWWPRQVWIDISVVATMFANSPFAEQLSWVLHKVGTDRVIFGSDYPPWPSCARTRGSPSS